MDQSDTYCKDCDGTVLKNQDGTTDSVDKCPGYEAGDEDIVETESAPDKETPEPVEEVSQPEPEPVEEEVAPPEPPKEEKKATTSKPQKKSPAPKKEEPKEETKEVEKDKAEDVTVSTHFINSDLVEINVESGISIEIKPGTLYKFSCGQKEKVYPKDAEKRREELWNLVNSQVDAQVAEISEFVKNAK